jgi:hypothetical protein
MAALVLEIRREIENRLPEAIGQNALIQLNSADGSLVLLQCDLTCETDHVKGTGRDGQWIEVPYSQIKTVSIAPR